MRNAVGFLALVLTLSACSSYVDSLAVMSVDLGYEFLKIAIVKPGVPMEIALNKEGRRKTANIVGFKDGERQFGDAALSGALKKPVTSYRFTNDLLAKPSTHPLVVEFQRRFPHLKLGTNAERGTATFKNSDDEEYSPEELLAMILGKAQETAAAFAEQPINGAVVTVPAFYSQAERRSVELACDLAGIKLLQLMTDNAAVALNYGVFRRKEFNATAQNYLFFDMGSRSTVASIASYQLVQTKENGVAETNPQVTIKAVGVDRTLGGLEFTLRLRDHLAKAFNGMKLAKKDVTSNAKAMNKLLKEAERVKLILSANKEAFAQVEGLMEEKDFKYKVKREEFLGLVGDLLERVTKPIEQAIKSSEMTWEEINQVLLFGGATRIPKVRDLIQSAAKGHEQLGMSLNTDESAALGAVYQAAHLSKGFRVKKFLVKDANVFPIEVEFERAVITEEGEETATETPGKIVRRVLFTRHNSYPQKKVLTFPKHRKDFEVRVNYGDISFLDDAQKLLFGEKSLFTVNLKGVDKAIEKHDAENVETKGVKAHFRMDESGIIQLERVESLFEKTVNEEETPKVDDPSTLDQIKDAFKNMWGDNKKEGEEEGQTAEGQEKQETDKEEKGEEEKEESKEEKKDEGKKEEAEEKKEEKTEEKKTEESAGDKDGKKEEEKKPEEEKKGGEEAATAAPMEEKKLVPKQVTVKEMIESSTIYSDMKPVSAESVKTAKATLKKLDDADEERVKREAAQNALETFIYDTKDKLNNDEFGNCATDEERQRFLEDLSAADDWLFDQEMDAAAKVFTDKLSSLQKDFSSFFKRLREKEQRPRAIAELFTHLNHSQHFYTMSKNMSDANPEDPIFTAVELQTLEKLNFDTQAWIDLVSANQKKKADHETPAFTVAEVETKISDLDREIKYLINKAKIHKPKPKKEEKKEDAAADKNATKDGKAEEKKTENEDEKTIPPTPESAGEAKPAEEMPPTPPPAEEPKPAEDGSKTDDTAADDGHKPGDEL